MYCAEIFLLLVPIQIISLSLELNSTGNDSIFQLNSCIHLMNLNFYSELRIEALNPPFMTMERPIITKAPSQILFNQVINLSMDIPQSLKTDNIQGDSFFILLIL